MSALENIHYGFEHHLNGRHGIGGDFGYSLCLEYLDGILICLVCFSAGPAHQMSQSEALHEGGGSNLGDTIRMEGSPIFCQDRHVPGSTLVFKKNIDLTLSLPIIYSLQSEGNDG